MQYHKTNLSFILLGLSAGVPLDFGNSPFRVDNIYEFRFERRPAYEEPINIWQSRCSSYQYPNPIPNQIRINTHPAPYNSLRWHFPRIWSLCWRLRMVTQLWIGRNVYPRVFLGLERRWRLFLCRLPRLVRRRLLLCYGEMEVSEKGVTGMWAETSRKCKGGTRKKN
jgi:hypothetical protein